jgi:hypothetical protein
MSGSSVDGRTRLESRIEARPPKHTKVVPADETD